MNKGFQGYLYNMLLSYSKAFYELKDRLQPLYDEREAVAITHEILYDITGLDKIARLGEKDTFFSQSQQEKYNQAVEALLIGKPVQYITGSAWFMGKEYHVNKHVLIPRPETEELVKWIIDELGDPQFPISNSKPEILDVGTGSGCIPISLKLAIPDADITSCDVSTEALKVAEENSRWQSTNVKFLQLNFLDIAQHNKLSTYDVIVSNPPYIPIAEKEKLHINVKDHEPGIALFVPDSNALVFYKAIAVFGQNHLKTNGYIYCELDAGHAMECKTMFEDAGYKDVLLRKDLNDNWRMLKATKG